MKLGTLEEREQERTGIPSLRIRHYEPIGYYIEITIEALSDKHNIDPYWQLPKEYRRINPDELPFWLFRFTTDDLGKR